MRWYLFGCFNTSCWGDDPSVAKQTVNTATAGIRQTSPAARELFEFLTPSASRDPDDITFWIVSPTSSGSSVQDGSQLGLVQCE
ncbi:hypothetical protein VTH82DRAFT_716 [Thermothelomyces myriococcoides]